MPTPADRAWFDSSLPSTHVALRSDMRLLMTFLDGSDLATLIDTEPVYQEPVDVTEPGMWGGNQNGASYLDSDVAMLQIAALRRLQQHVDKLGSETYYGKELFQRGMQTLAIMTQLVSLEVFSFVEGHWETHLQAARTLLGMFQNKWAPELFAENAGVSSAGETLSNQCSTQDLKALEYFITSFVWVDIIANATHGPPPFDPRHFNYAPLLRNGSLTPQQTMGCQSCIMKAITEKCTNRRRLFERTTASSTSYEAE
ncbi:uncharacterized protein BDZ99DRAFT_572879 [Mytilinidion resinicola]|uniref:Transcription factor domain-containing protein n=1 Tax=Mytilinidion resinicola TaxID=574789 RepID=A0A6A6YJA9_9PEZI|nr:uncharacterized protein BDZ99DRAFT_572879 [Mytilinidion resinicola]KAF2808007.1 hypothetical protein BDZ99DRAFT_572879 [Mytilinidion resinicola]